MSGTPAASSPTNGPYSLLPSNQYIHLKQWAASFPLFLATFFSSLPLKLTLKQHTKTMSNNPICPKINSKTEAGPSFAKIFA